MVLGTTTVLKISVLFVPTAIAKQRHMLVVIKRNKFWATDGNIGIPRCLRNNGFSVQLRGRPPKLPVWWNEDAQRSDRCDRKVVQARSLSWAPSNGSTEDTALVDAPTLGGEIRVGSEEDVGVTPTGSGSMVVKVSEIISITKHCLRGW